MKFFIKSIIYKVTLIDKLISYIFCCFIPYKSWRRKFRNNPFFINSLIGLLFLPSTKKFTHELAIVAIVKNEGAYIKEWIEFHKLVGVSKFYIYDNDSNDDLKIIIQKYIDDGIVEYRFFPGEKMQKSAYVDAVLRYSGDIRWLAIVDLDEFILPLSYKTIPDFLNANNSYNQFLMFTYTFGDNGHKIKNEGLVVERFTKRSFAVGHQKAIINPRAIKYCMNHSHGVFGKTLIVNPNDVQINHYCVKSYEEFLAKKARGDAWNGKNSHHFDNLFQFYNTNEVEDKIILKYASQINKNMND